MGFKRKLAKYEVHGWAFSRDSESWERRNSSRQGSQEMRKLIFSEGKQNSSVTEGRAGGKAGGCLRNELYAQGG